MKRPVLSVLAIVLAAALMSPALAYAGKGNGKPTGNGHNKSVESISAVPSKANSGSPHKTAPGPASANANATRSARGATEPSGSIEPEPSHESSDVAAPNVSNAFEHITLNIERSLAKMTAGTKKQVPPGLLRVWLKFAGWLGIDPATMPGAKPTDAVEPTSTIEPTSTPVPTETVEPPAAPVQ